MSVKHNAARGRWEVRWRQDGRQRSQLFASERTARRRDVLIGELLEAGHLDDLSIVKDTDGSWAVRWADQRLDRHHRVFETKADAVAFEGEIVKLRRAGKPTDRIDRGTITLDDYVGNVWTPEHLVNLERATVRFYLTLWRVHLKPTFGTMPLQDITPDIIGRWKTERESSGAGRTSIRQAMTLLGGILQHAVYGQEIAANPVRSVRKIATSPKVPVVPLAPITIERVRLHALDPFDRMLIALLAYSGLRPSEAWALQWGDIRDRTIHVQRATDGDGDSKTTKTRSDRSVRILAPLAQDLAEWKIASGRPADKALIFPPRRSSSKYATRHEQAHWRKLRWSAAWKAAVAAGTGVQGEPSRVYDLRHSFASLLLAEGRTLHQVAAQLGHSPMLTADVYGHVLAEHQDDDAVRLDPEKAIRAARMQASATAVRRADDEQATG